MRIRISASVINFKDKAVRTWGLKEWEGIEDKDQDLLFFGLYTQIDYDVFWRHQGKKSVFWCGGDLKRFVNNWEWQRIVKQSSDTKHYVESKEQEEELKALGIKSEVKPSFLEYMDDFPISFVPSQSPHIWMCAHPEREEEYGVSIAERMAKKFPDYNFHVYGIDGESHDNFTYHGKVSEEQFNREIKKYHCGLRPNTQDGNSEVVMKSMLLGQYPISRLPWEKVWQYEDEEQLIKLLAKLKTIKESNIKARSYWIRNLNDYPWCKKEFYNE